MSDYKFSCPHCRQSLETIEKLPGQTIQCPNCNGSIDIAKPAGDSQPTQSSKEDALSEEQARPMGDKKKISIPSTTEWQAGELPSMLKHWADENPRSRKEVSGRAWENIGGGIVCGVVGIFVLMVFGHVKGSGLVTVPLIFASPCFIIYGLYYLFIGLSSQANVSCPLCHKEIPFLSHYADFACTECNVFVRVVGDVSKAQALYEACPYCKSTLFLIAGQGTLTCYSCGTQLDINGSKIDVKAQSTGTCQKCNQKIPDGAHICVTCESLQRTDFAAGYRDIDIFTLSSSGHLLLSQAGVAELKKKTADEPECTVVWQTLQKRLALVKRCLVSLEKAAEDTAAIRRVASVLSDVQGIYCGVILAIHKTLSAKKEQSFKDERPFEFPAELHNRIADRVKTLCPAVALPVWEPDLIGYRTDPRTDTVVLKFNYVVTSVDKLLQEATKLDAYALGTLE